MKVKVCGIKLQKNLEDISSLPIDMIGLNFYNKSSRYVEQLLDMRPIPNHVAKVGVFVNHDLKEVISIIKKFSLDYVQLHGHESPEYVNELTSIIKVIKAISINDSDDVDTTEIFSNCTYFLFDTKTHLFGGSGNKFDWSLLDAYQGNTPFFLAGGIGPKDYKEVLNIKHRSFVGIDINSKFETEPGIKDVILIEQFINKIKQRLKVIH